MPRTRQSSQAQIAASYIGSKAAMPAKPKGRPRKVKAVDFENVTITPVANGYTVQSVTAGKNMFVFEDLDKAFDFIRASLKPTTEQTAVLNAI